MARSASTRRRVVVGTLLNGVAAMLFVASAKAAIIGTCTILVGAQGTMTANAAINVLGSRQAGGSPATTSVQASSLLCSLFNLIDCYSVSAPAPSAFLSAPPGGGTNVGFGTVFRLNGGSDLSGNTPVRVTNGTHALAVDLTATKSTGVFSAGAYRAEVIVRCE